MTVPAEDIKALREKTGAGILDCRTALEETNGDLDAAIQLLRERGLSKAAKRADRETSNGRLELYNHGEGRVGVMVEVNCETDFVARTEEFQHFAHEIALQIAAMSPQYVSPEDVPEEVLEEQRESARKMAEQENKPAEVIERIVEGRLDKFLDEACLIRQTYIRDEERTVEGILQDAIIATGENVVVRRFQRWELGEEIE